MFLCKRSILLSLLQPQPDVWDQAGRTDGGGYFRCSHFLQSLLRGGHMPHVVEAVLKRCFNVISHRLRGAKLHLGSESFAHELASWIELSGL